MSENNRTQINGISAQLEELWRCLDDLFATMSPADWQRQHGADWIFADLPYHLGYIDHYLVAHPVKMGLELPESERIVTRTLNELNAWNQSQFAKRPSDQSLETSLAQMNHSRAAIRELLVDMVDSDLTERQGWFALLNIRGMRPFQTHLGFCLSHVWGHLEEARIRLGQAETAVSSDLTHFMLNDAVNFLPSFTFNPHSSQEADFTAMIKVSGIGGGTWTHHIHQSTFSVSETEAAQPDLIITQTSEAAIKIRYGINDIPSLLTTGELQVNDKAAFATYGNCFSFPDFDYVFEPLP